MKQIRGLMQFSDINALTRLSGLKQIFCLTDMKFSRPKL